MAPRSWATDEQQKFLIDHMDDFFGAQKDGKLLLFWPKIQNLWYKKWPEPGMDGGPPVESNDNLTTRIQAQNKVKITRQDVP